MKKRTLGISLCAALATIAISFTGFAVVGPITGDAGMRDNNYYDTLGKDYDMYVQFNTNNPVQLILVVGLPLLTQAELLSEIRGTVGTDGAGKIDGSHYATIYWDGESNHKNNFTSFNIDVTGSISSRGSVPIVKMNLKGLGYDVGSASNYNGEATLKLTFLSSGVLQSVSNSITVGSGTNDQSGANVYMELPGTISGTIRRGPKATPIKLARQSAVLRSGNFAHDNEGIIVGVDPDNSNIATFTPYSIGLEIATIDHFDARVVQPSTRFSLAGQFFSTIPSMDDLMDLNPDDIAGTGAVDKTGGFRASLRGIAHHRGPKLRMTGRTGTLIVDYDGDGNPITVSGALKNNIEITGKFLGQFIDLRSGTALDVPQP